MIYIILGVGVVVVVAVTMLNRGGDKTPHKDPALDAAQRVRDNLHITDEGDAHGKFERGVAPPLIEGGEFASSSVESKTESQNVVVKSPDVPSVPAFSDLVWSGKGSRLEVAGLSISGAMTYWSNGRANVKEPCCVDVSLPVRFDAEIGLPEISGTYEAMSPEQRGAYLRWLSRGRMGALSHSYFRMWFFGIERRAMFDKKDAPFCLGELSMRLPSLLENPSLSVFLRFLTCVAVSIKYPTEKLALDLRCVQTLPLEILNVLLAPYAGTEMRVPPLIAYTVMRSAYPGNDGAVLHNDEQMMLFASAYNDGMDMGMTLIKPKTPAFVAYYPTNPSLSGSAKPLASIETPDFFKDPSQFAPLLAIWEQVRNVRLNKPTLPPRTKLKPKTEFVEDEEIPTTLDKEMRGEMDAFIEEKRDDKDKKNNENETLFLPLVEISELIELEIGERPTGAQRRGLCEITRTGGRLVVPDLGISGKIYNWEDLVALVWTEIGERVSDAYRAAAILFEFASSFIDEKADRKKRLVDFSERITLHFELSKDENERLAVLSKILEQQNVRSENLGECFKNWLQQEDRELLRDFFFRLCAPAGEGHARERDELINALSELLDVEGRPQPISKSGPQELGEELKNAVAHLFRSEEIKNEK